MLKRIPLVWLLALVTLCSNTAAETTPVHRFNGVYRPAAEQIKNSYVKTRYREHLAQKREPVVLQIEDHTATIFIPMRDTPVLKNTWLVCASQTGFRLQESRHYPITLRFTPLDAHKHCNRTDDTVRVMTLTEENGIFYCPACAKKGYPDAWRNVEAIGAVFDAETADQQLTTYQKTVSLVKEKIARLNKLDEQGRKQGTWVTLYDDREKEIKDIMRAEWYQEAEFKNGRQVGKRVRFDFLGTKRLHCNMNAMKDGYCERYHANGQLKAKMTYKKGEADGQIVVYTSEGRLRKKFTLVAGRPEGKAFFYKNGILMEEANFKHHKKSGQQKKYYENGIIQTIENYKNGLKQGLQIHFNPSGEKQWEAVYEPEWYGKRLKSRLKKEITYDANGKQTCVRLFKPRTTAEVDCKAPQHVTGADKPKHFDSLPPFIRAEQRNPYADYTDTYFALWLLKGEKQAPYDIYRENLPHTIVTGRDQNLGIDYRIIHSLDSIRAGIYLDADFLNRDEGVLVGGHGLAIKKTSDGGKSWKRFKFSSRRGKFHSVARVGKTKLFVVGESRFIFRSEDGGDNWTIIDTAEVTLRKHAYPRYYKVTFFDETLGFILGYHGKHGALFTTGNGGRTWSLWNPLKQAYCGNTDAKCGLIELQFLESNYFLMADHDANLYMSNDRGVSWNWLSQIKGRTIDSIFFLDRVNGFAGGKQFLLKTRDGGKTWHPVRLSLDQLKNQVDYKVSDIYFSDHNTGFITIDTTIRTHTEEAVKQKGKLVYQTNNAGETWHPLHLGDGSEIRALKLKALTNKTLLVLSRKHLYQIGL